MNGSTILTNMLSNSTLTKNISSQPQPQLKKTPMWTATTVILPLMIVAIVLGNILVLVTTWLDKRLHQPNKYFIACLAVADLLVGIFSVPIRLSMQLDPFKFVPLNLCRFWFWMDIFCEVASIVTLTVISADRYFKISKPFKYRSRMDTSRSVIVIVNIWLIATVSATLSLFSFGGSGAVMSIASRGCLNDNGIYYTIVSVVFFFVPTLVIILMYVFIFLIAHRRQKMNRRGELGQSFATRDKKKGKEFRQELKTIRMLSLVVFTFILCWGPTFVFLLIKLYHPEYIRLTFHDYQIVGSLFDVILPSFNSLCNPVIYACFDREYSKAFKQLLKRYFLCAFISRQNTQRSQTSNTCSTVYKEHSMKSNHSIRNSSSSRLMFELQDNPSNSQSNNKPMQNCI